MKGANILLNGNEPKGRFMEGVASGNLIPGMFAEVVPATEPQNGRLSYRPYSIGTNGDRRPIIIVLDDDLQGVKASLTGANTYTAGRRCFLYAPINGDELNILLKNISGTSDLFAIGDLIMADVATGKGLVQNAAASYAPFTVQETVAALTADNLTHCRFG